MQSTLDEFLQARSSVTSTQLSTILLKRGVDMREISLKDVMDSRRGMSMGSYYRILSQGKSNIVKSLYTLLLAARLGVLSLDDFQRLVNLVSKLPQDASSTDVADVVPLVDALVRRIVIL
jgi:hypothetical protein